MRPRSLGAVLRCLQDHPPYGLSARWWSDPSRAVNAGSDALARCGAAKWLSDDRLNGLLPKEELEWGFEDWNLRTINAGWKYWALVVPQAIADAGAMIPMINYLYEYGLRLMVFADLGAAFNWLDQVSESKPVLVKQQPDEMFIVRARNLDYRGNK